MSAPKTPPIAHVVSHTHWDREWHKTFQHFRMRLVAVTDAVLDLLERDPEYRYFYWDGQTSVIEDYLEIRPEAAERLRNHFASGRLYTGPWYIQPDEFLVSGESFVRNLLLGKKMCEEWGTGASVGYAPDAFGHISQMPQILQGFGIDNAILFRGVTTDQADAEFRWRSPDGSEVLCIKMPDENAYSNFYYLHRSTFHDTDTGSPLDAERISADSAKLLELSLAERPSTSNLLWMDGVDHIYPQERTPEIIRITNEALSGRVRAIHSTLPAFLLAVRDADPSLKTIEGELRHSNRAWKLQALLAHVASSRIHLKQLNHECETLLEKWAEPFCAFAWALGREYPAGFLAYAWKQLLLNQPHDSLCGCSVDQVHRDMLPRYEQCRQVGEKLVSDALEWIADRVDTSREAEGAGAIASLVVFNPLGWDRSEVVEAEVDLPYEGAPDRIALSGADGIGVPSEIEELTPYHTLYQAPHDIPTGQRRRRWRVRFAAEAPAFGYRRYWVRGEERLGPSSTKLACGPGWIQNSVLRVDLSSNGTLTVTERETGNAWRGLLLFEDGGDLGDGYNYRPPAEDRVLTTKGETVPFAARGASLGDPWNASASTSSGAIEAELTLVLPWHLPHNRHERASGPSSERNLLHARVSLQAGSPAVHVSLTVHNASKDHRLRVLFPTGLREAGTVHAEQAFDVVERTIARPDCTGWKEPQPATAPMKTFVDVSNGQRGFCLISRGIPEYEAMDDEQRTLALTLLRCTGQGVGKPEEQEEGQMIGAHRFDFALLFHKGTWQEARVWREAHAFNAPMRAAQTGVHEGELPPEGGFLEVFPDAAVCTAVKRSETGRDLLVRTVNYGATELRCGIGPGPELAGSTRWTGIAARLDETPLEPLPVSGGRAEFASPARRIATVLLRPE